jgi:flagellar hook-associated protein 2
MSTISSTGIGSGLDIDSLVSKLVAAERSAGQTRIDNKKGKLTEQFSAMATLMGGMSAFQSSLNSLVSAGSFTSRKVSVSDEAAFTAKAGPSAAAGSYDVQVEQLAKASQLGSEPFALASTQVGTGTLHHFGGRISLSASRWVKAATASPTFAMPSTGPPPTRACRHRCSPTWKARTWC